MKVLLHTETNMTLAEFDHEVFDVTAEKPELHFAALQMFIASLGLCTGAVLAAYGRRPIRRRGI